VFGRICTCLASISEDGVVSCKVLFDVARNALLSQKAAQVLALWLCIPPKAYAHRCHAGSCAAEKAAALFVDTAHARWP
jgi:hypothetical protein